MSNDDAVFCGFNLPFPINRELRFEIQPIKRLPRFIPESSGQAGLNMSNDDAVFLTTNLNPPLNENSNRPRLIQRKP